MFADGDSDPDCDKNMECDNEPEHVPVESMQMVKDVKISDNNAPKLEDIFYTLKFAFIDFEVSAMDTIQKLLELIATLDNLIEHLPKSGKKQKAKASQSSKRNLQKLQFKCRKLLLRAAVTHFQNHPCNNFSELQSLVITHVLAIVRYFTCFFQFPSNGCRAIRPRMITNALYLIYDLPVTLRETLSY